MMRLTESRLHNIIIESINNLLLTESQEQKSISAAKKLVMQELGYNEQEADEFIRIKLRGKLPSLKTKKGGKFIYGVARMYCAGQLTDANTIGRLNTTLKYVASDAHINEYRRDLNGMSAQDLINRFAAYIEMDLENDKAKLDQKAYTSASDYDIVRIDSFEQAEEYSDYVDWCVTYDDYLFWEYTKGGFNQFYFCLKKGFEQVPEEQGEGCPLDEYGLSMIAVCVNENGRLESCTCRWNLENGGSEDVMDTEQISDVIQMPFYSVFKPNTMWKDGLANAMQRLANGESPQDVFDECSRFSEGFATVTLNGKYNFINQNNEIAFPNQWYDYAGTFEEGFAVISLNHKANFINQNGKIAFPDKSFDACETFSYGFAVVELNDKYNFIDRNGNILYKPNEPDKWFDYCFPFAGKFAKIRLNGELLYLDEYGNLTRPQVSESYLRNVIRESIMNHIKMNTIK